MLSCACLLILFSLLLCFFVNFYKLHTPFGRLEVPLPIKKNERTPFTTICLFHFFFVPCFVHCFSLPSLTREMTSISPYLIPKQNFPSSISVLVFCKVYSGKSEKSEPFPLFYITKTKRSKNSGKILKKNALSLLFLHPSTVNLRCVRQSSCVVWPPHTHSLRYVTNFVGPFFADFSKTFNSSISYCFFTFFSCRTPVRFVDFLYCWRYLVYFKFFALYPVDSSHTDQYFVNCFFFSL